MKEFKACISRSEVRRLTCSEKEIREKVTELWKKGEEMSLDEVEQLFRLLFVLEDIETLRKTQMPS